MPELDGAGNEDGKGAAAAADDKKPAARPGSLDDVHRKVMAELGDEANNISAVDDDEAEDEDAGANDADDTAEDTVEDEDDADDGAGAGDGAAADEDDAGAGAGTGTVEDDAAAAKPPAAAADDDIAEPVRDTDITKPGKYKTEFVDVDGTKYYVNSVAELPDDFEPKSSRAFGMAVEELADKKADFNHDHREYEAQAAQAENTKAVRELRSTWDREIADLTKGGQLPKEAAKQKEVIDEVYKLMAAEHAAGRTVESFRQAFRMYRADVLEKQAAEASKKRTEQRKARGAKVMGGNGGAGSGKPKIRRGVPPGTSLDMVHSKVLMDLQQ